VHQKSFEGVDPAEVGRIVRKYGGVERSLEFAREYADRARGALGTFSPSPAREALDWALDFVLSRDH
ncbi:MAG TPA: polyprenyl synthetase family protein, partial [Thermoanaerobaculia bacterium]